MPSVQCYSDKLTEDFEKLQLKAGETAVMALGGAGFYIKFSNGTTVLIDPYLSDCVEEEIGFKRLLPRLFSPAMFRPNILVCSHEHLDHLDTVAVPQIMQNSKTTLCTTPTAAALATEKGVEKSRINCLKRGERCLINNIEVHAVFAGHGDLSPDAVGVILTSKDMKIYFTGDTNLCSEIKEIAAKEKPDLLILPINGMYGNLNEYEAAELADISKANWIIPCHYGLFVEHGANPYIFAQEMKKRKNSGCHFLGLGESIILQK